MKGNSKVIEGLNEALSEELTAINQYFLHAEMCENWGYERLASTVKKLSIQEMKHAEHLIERILFLEGAPNMTKYRKLGVGRNVPEMIDNDLQLELSAISMYNRLVELAAKEGDYGSADLFKQLLKDEEHHADELEEQQSRIDGMGLQNFLASQTEK